MTNKIGWYFAFLLQLVFITNGQHDRRLLASSQGPAKVSAADLAKLRWIEGMWRGTGVDQSPFFEGYRFENETTLVVDSFADEKLDKVKDTDRFELRDGEFGNGSYVAASIDEQGINFNPVPGKAKNYFRLQRESADKWTAILKWPAADGKPARERIYNMERIRKKY